MASYNRVVLVGNLTRDPQLSYTPQNTPMCKFGMAINRKWRDRDGNSQEDVCFVDCTHFGRGAEVFNQYMSKGGQVLVEGRLQFQQWTSPEGQKRSKHEVIVENFTFLGGGRAGEAAAPGAEMDAGGPPPAQPATKPGYDEAPRPGYDEAPPPPEDGIPF